MNKTIYNKIKKHKNNKITMLETNQILKVSNCNNKREFALLLYKKISGNNNNINSPSMFTLSFKTVHEALVLRERVQGRVDRYLDNIKDSEQYDVHILPPLFCRCSQDMFIHYTDNIIIITEKATQSVVPVNIGQINTHIIDHLVKLYNIGEVCIDASNVKKILGGSIASRNLDQREKEQQ